MLIMSCKSYLFDSFYMLVKIRTAARGTSTTGALLQPPIGTIAESAAAPALMLQRRPECRGGAQRYGRRLALPSRASWGTARPVAFCVLSQEPGASRLFGLIGGDASESCCDQEHGIVGFLVAVLLASRGMRGERLLGCAQPCVAWFKCRWRCRWI